MAVRETNEEENAEKRGDVERDESDDYLLDLLQKYIQNGGHITGGRYKVYGKECANFKTGMVVTEIKEMWFKGMDFGESYNSFWELLESLNE